MQNSSNGKPGISLLYAEDDSSLAMVTMDALQREGYRVMHSRVGVNAMEAFLKESADLCLIDVQLPDIDGLSLAKMIRSSSDTVSIVFISGKISDEDRLDGYRAGGDDYLTKPYSIDELLYKIIIYVKRSSGASVITPVRKIRVGGFILDKENLTLYNDGTPNRITEMEASLIELFFKNQNKLLKRGEILKYVWKIEDEKVSRSLDVFISRIRKYLQEGHSLRLESHKRVGYKLTALD
jgi:DNA-binding response OmpR family regulator